MERPRRKTRQCLKQDEEAELDQPEEVNIDEIKLDEPEEVQIEEIKLEEPVEIKVVPEVKVEIKLEEPEDIKVEPEVKVEIKLGPEEVKVEIKLGREEVNIEAIKSEEPEVKVEIKSEPMDCSTMEEQKPHAKPSETFREAVKLENHVPPEELGGKAEKKSVFIANAMTKIRNGFKKMGKSEEMPSQKVIYDLLNKLHKTSLKGDKDTLVRRALKVTKIIGKYYSIWNNSMVLIMWSLQAFSNEMAPPLFLNHDNFPPVFCKGSVFFGGNIIAYLYHSIYRVSHQNI
jgi:hypothetical protein